MSPSIAARRARILSTARAMILESGLQFAIRDLADRAEVAFGSIYYLFGSKEELVAYVLEDFIHELRSTRAADRAGDPLSIDILLRDLDAKMQENMRLSFKLIKATDSLVYSDAAGAKIRGIVHRVRAEKFEVILDALAAEDALQPWVCSGAVVADLVAVEGALIHEWCMGELSDEEFRARRLAAIASLLVALTAGPARRSAEAAAETYGRALAAVMGSVRAATEAVEPESAAVWSRGEIG